MILWITSITINLNVNRIIKIKKLKRLSHIIIILNHDNNKIIEIVVWCDSKLMFFVFKLQTRINYDTHTQCMCVV